MNSIKVAQVSSSGNLTWIQTSGIITGNFYYFTVSAINGRGESNQTDPVGAYAATVPSKVLYLRNLTSNSSQITIAWTEPNTNGGSAISY